MDTYAKSQYADDAPIATSANDKFSRAPFAERVAHVIAQRTDPSSIVVGIYGPWGDGKTSVLNMMTEALAGDQNVICIPFNPWHFESESHLIRAFFDSLADSLGKKIDTKGEELGKVLSKYGSVLSFASIPFGVDPGAAAIALGEKLSSVELDDLKSRVSNLLAESGKRVLVFVDDIDRLDRAEIHALLKLIKLSASFQNTAYVLAFDDDVVSASLGERYGTGDAAAGRSFLEKIIQVPLHLPDAEPIDLRAIAFDGVDEVLSANAIELSQDDAEAFARHFTEGVLPALRTPRQVKRFVNAIRFAVPLLKGEVHTVDLLLLEALRTAYPSVYLAVRDHQDTYTGESFTRGFNDSQMASNIAKSTVEAGLEGIGTGQKEPALYLLKILFPRLNGVFGGSSYGTDWNKSWNDAKRITSSSYFRRYFQYSVPTRDVPDADVSDFLIAALAGNTANIESFFNRVGERKAWSRALDKLFTSAAALDPSSATTIAMQLAKHAKAIPREHGMFSSFASPTARAATLVSDLIDRIQDRPSRLKAAIDVAKQTPCLLFGIDCLRWMSPSAREADDPGGLTEDETKQVGAVLAGRIKDAITGENDYWSLGRDLGRVLWVWKTYGKDGEMVAFLTERFKNAPAEAVRFVDAFIGRAYGLESGLSHRSRLDRSEFDAIAALVDPAMILDALRANFADVVNVATFDKCYEYTGDQQTVCRFAAIVNKVKQEETAGVGTLPDAPAEPRPNGN